MPNRLRTLALILAAAALSCGISGTASADSELRRALSKVPARMAIDRSGIAASFVGLSQLRALYADDLVSMGLRVSFASNDTMKAFFSSPEAAWQADTGLKRDEIASFTDYGAPPRAVVLWRFTGPGVVDPFVKGLNKRGFSQANGLWRNGEPMMVDIARRNPKNPFLGPLGRASMIAPFLDGMAQSPDPQAAAEAGAVTAQNSLAAMPPVEAALDGIEEITAKGTIVQGLVLTPALWLQGADMGELLTASPTVDMKALADKMAEQARKPGTPIPVGAVIADVEIKEPARNGVVIALPYGDCSVAQDGARIFADKWKTSVDRGGKTGAERTGLEAVVTIHQGKQACVALISLLSSPDAERSNPVLRYVIGAIWQRDFKALQGG